MLKTPLLITTLLPVLLTPFALQSADNPFLGRWDLTVTSPQRTWPQWMELKEENGNITGRIQPQGGAVRDIVSAQMDGSHLVIVNGPAGQNPEVTWNLTASGDKISGFQKRGENTDTKLEGVRAPKLNRPMPKTWGRPESLFNGKDLSGWEPLGDRSKSRWVVTPEGELFNEDRGANIRTTRTFQDFQLHIEVNCPKGCNSGIYLRGRDEIQVGTEGGKLPSHEMGALYGFTAPSVDMGLAEGKWVTFDITLVGRTLTVLRDGTKIHDHLEIPGITGGALDSHEAEPGPIFLQGDHDGGMKYRNIKITLPKS